MIDTGSTRSFVSPQLAQEYFYNFKQNEQFEVVSTHASSKHGEVVVIPLPSIFNSSEFHKFYVYSVDNRYDGLIGSDLLKVLGAQIDMKYQRLTTKETCIPIIYKQPFKETFILPERSEMRIKLPVNLIQGDAILNFKEFTEGVRMPTAIVKCENGWATTVIQNCRDDKMELTITQPFKVESFVENQVNLNYLVKEKETGDVDKLLTENLSKLRLEHMNAEEKEIIKGICEEYKDIFYCEEIPLSFTNEVKHKIRTKNEDPIYIKAHRSPPAQTAEIRNQIEKMLKDNVIQKSFSPWSAPVHLVPKKMDMSGKQKWRMVIDYRRLNDITIDDKYPLPNINDLFDMLGKSMYFTTLDLASGYHQIEVDKEDRAKTAFSTPFGHYEFNRMPFGLKTAPATFQRAMDNVLRGLQGLHCLVYLDDVIIFSKSLHEHAEKLKAVFDRLRETNLKVQLDKSHFLRKEVLYLGHTITSEGLKPNNDKIDAVLKYPLPTSVTEIKSFLGLVGYYRKFIKDFARITRPMTLCLKKGRKILLDDEYKESFEICKKILTNAPLLQFPDFEKPFILTTDASNYAIGAVLSQGSIGSDRPVAYASRTLSDTESRYSTIEKELLAVIWAVKHFRPYLWGRKFSIYTDHRPLAWLYSLNDPNSKLTRWRLRLEEYDFDIYYKKGAQNTNADALSRVKINYTDESVYISKKMNGKEVGRIRVYALGDDEGSMKVNLDQESEEDLDEFVRKIADEMLGPSTSKNKDINDEIDVISLNSDSSKETVKLGSDKSLDEVIEILDSDNSTSRDKSGYNMIQVSDSDDGATAHSISNREHEGIPILNEAVDSKPKQIHVHKWFRNDICVNDISTDKQKILEIFLPGVNNEHLVKKFLKEYVDFKHKYYIYFEIPEFRKIFSKVVTILYKKGTQNLVECTERVVNMTDETDQRAVVLKYHEGKTCHRGIRETLTRLRRHYWWANMKETVTAIINTCEQCRKMKYDRKPIKPMLQLTQTPFIPFEEVFMDLLYVENKYYVTLVDSFSKIGQAYHIPNRSTPEVVRVLIKYFSTYGLPKKISCDSGTEFNNNLLKELLSMYKIDMHVGTPNNPNSMAIVERFHSTILEIYRLAKYDKSELDAASVMTYAIMAYNNTIHSATNFTPFEIIFGHTDAGNMFDIDRDKNLLQKLVQDHKKRLTVLYKHLSDKMKIDKKKVREKKGGEDSPEVKEGDVVFMKTTRTRKAKEKPRYEKAKVVGTPNRNIVPVQLNKRETKVAIKNIKRPPQVVASNMDGGHTSGRGRRYKPAGSESESWHRSDSDGHSSDSE